MREERCANDFLLVYERKFTHTYIFQKTGMSVQIIIFIKSDSYEIHEQPTRPSSLLTPTASLRVPKTPFRFDHLLRFPELPESYYAHGYSLLHQKDRD